MNNEFSRISACSVACTLLCVVWAVHFMPNNSACLALDIFSVSPAWLWLQDYSAHMNYDQVLA